MANQILATNRLMRHVSINNVSQALFLPANVLTPDIRTEIYRQTNRWTLTDADTLSINFQFDHARNVNFIAINGVRGIGNWGNTTGSTRNLIENSISPVDPGLPSRGIFDPLELFNDTITQPDDVVGPFNDLCWYIDPNSDLALHQLVYPDTAKTQIISCPAGTQYTMSCYVKIDPGADASRDHFQLRIRESVSHEIKSRFDIANDLIDTSIDTGDTTHDAASITDVGNGWKRIALTGTWTTAQTEVKFFFDLQGGDNNLFVASPPGDGMWWAHPEVVLGDTATPVKFSPPRTNWLDSGLIWRVLLAVDEASLTDGTEEYDSGLLSVVMGANSPVPSRKIIQSTEKAGWWKRYQRSHHYIPSGIDCQHMRIELYNSSGAVDLGNVMFDEALVAPMVRERGVDVMAQSGVDDKQITESGAIWTSADQRLRSPSHSLIFLTDAAASRYYDLTQEVGSSGQAYLALEDTGGTHDDIKSIYGYPRFSPMFQRNGFREAAIEIEEIT